MSSTWTEREPMACKIQGRSVNHRIRKNNFSSNGIEIWSSIPDLSQICAEYVECFVSTYLSPSNDTTPGGFAGALVEVEMVQLVNELRSFTNDKQTISHVYHKQRQSQCPTRSQISHLYIQIIQCLHWIDFTRLFRIIQYMANTWQRSQAKKKDIDIVCAMTCHDNPSEMLTIYFGDL